MSTNLDALAKRMGEEIMRRQESDIMRLLTPSTSAPIAFQFIEPKFQFEPIYRPERADYPFRWFNPYNHVIVHQPSALLMVTACESDGVFFTDRESRACRNWNRAKARKDRRRARYWAGVCRRLERNGH